LATRILVIGKKKAGILVCIRWCVFILKSSSLRSEILRAVFQRRLGDNFTPGCQLSKSQHWLGTKFPLGAKLAPQTPLKNALCCFCLCWAHRNGKDCTDIRIWTYELQQRLPYCNRFDAKATQPFPVWFDEIDLTQKQRFRFRFDLTKSIWRKSNATVSYPRLILLISSMYQSKPPFL
jgi:hypothetical protein